MVTIQQQKTGLAKCSILLFKKFLVQDWDRTKVIVNEDFCGPPQSSVISQLHHDYFLPNVGAIPQLQHDNFLWTPVLYPLHQNYLLSNTCAIISTTQLLSSKLQCHISTTPLLLPPKCQCQLHNFFLPKANVISQLHNYFHLNSVPYLNNITTSKCQCHISTTPQLLQCK